MKCLRCGHCCINYLVVVVDNPEEGFKENNLIVNKGDRPCKHLLGNSPGEYKCAVHHKEWYKDTPCFEFTQIESKDSPCRLGEEVVKKHIEKREN